MNLGGGPDELDEDAAAFGIKTAERRDECAVLAENWDTVQAFVAVQTQWRHGPSGHPTGLDYASVRVAVAAMGIRFKEVFQGLRVMEAEVLGGQDLR